MTGQPLDPAAISEQAQALLDASRSADGGSPWVTAYDGDYYVHNGYSRMARAAFSEEVADLIAAAPDLAATVVRLASALAAAQEREGRVVRLLNWTDETAAQMQHLPRLSTREVRAALAGEGA